MQKPLQQAEAVFAAQTFLWHVCGDFVNDCRVTSTGMTARTGHHMPTGILPIDIWCPGIR